MGRRTGNLILVVVVLCACGSAWAQKAGAPNPADGATDVLQPLLRWTAGAGAMFHNLYLGTTPDLTEEHLVAERQVMTMYWHAPGVTSGTRYYWRVDEIEVDGVTVHTGDVWTFLAQPLIAFMPEPADGSNEAMVAPILMWQAGQTAQSHHVYFSADQAAVTDGAATADQGLVTESNFTPGELEPATSYHWRVDEVVPDGTERTGDVWSFTTMLPVDDFESYTDEEGSRIYEAWIDGWVNDTGSTVGYVEAPFAEQEIIHGGTQSMPLDYNNVGAPHYSEAEFDFGSAQDWAASGVETLILHIQGSSADLAVPRVSSPPVLDAEMEDLWLTASVQSIEIAINGETDGPADCSGSFRALCDSEYLYVLVDVSDETLVQDSDPTQGWHDDRIEIFIDGDNNKGDSVDSVNDYQYCFRWNHGQVEVPVEWYHSPQSLQGVEYAVVTTDSGYRFEVALPWLSMIEESPSAGFLFGMDVVINDDDDGGDRDTQLAGYIEGTTNPHTPSLWATAVVTEAGAGDGDRFYVALQDTANHTGVVVHPDPELAKAVDWVKWQIPLSDFVDAGVNLDAVRRIFIGMGDRDNPAPGNAGVLFIDDIYLAMPATVVEE